MKNPVAAALIWCDQNAMAHVYTYPTLFEG
jgi:hypothetical protein